MSTADIKKAIDDAIAMARDGLDTASRALVNIQALKASIPDDATPVPVPTPTPTPAPTPSGRTIWLSTHVGAALQTDAVCQQYGAIRPTNNYRCDWYMSAGDAGPDGKFDGDNAAFAARAAEYGPGRTYPITIDWESYSGGNMLKEVSGSAGASLQNRAIAEFTKVIDAIKKYCPKAPVGIYNFPWCGGGYSSVLTPASWWLAQEDSLAALYARVDYLSPGCYNSYSVADTARWSDLKDIQLCTNEAELCRRIVAKHPHLKVYPYYQVIFRGSGTAYDQTIVPVKEWYNHIRRFTDIIGDGAIWWSGSGSPVLPVSHLAAMRAALDKKPMP